MGAIPFSYIPPNIRLPFFKIEFAGGAAGNQTNQQSVLVGQITEGTPLQPTYMPSAAVAAATFGPASMLAQMVRDYMASDPMGTLYVVGVDDGEGVKAAGSIAFTGAATAGGTLSLYIASQYVPVAIPAGMTAAQAAAAVTAAIAAWIDPNGILLPVTATTAEATVDLTAVHAGFLGNDIDVRLNYAGVQSGQQTPAGLTVAITAMTGGTGAPTLTGLGATLGTMNADYLCAPWNDAPSLNAMQTLMGMAAGRWNYETQLYGHVFAAKKDADNTGATNIAFGATRNDPMTSVFSFEPGMPSPTWSVAAAVMGAFAVASRADPARPSQTLAVPALLPPPANENYPPNVMNTLLSNGMAVLQYEAGGVVAICRTVTTYQFNAWGTPDQSYLDAETLYTLMAVARDLQATVTTVYPRAKLADDGTNFGAQLSADPTVDAPICTPNSARSVIVTEYENLEVNEAWVEDTDTFEAGLIVQRSATDPSRLDVLYDPQLVSGLRIFAVLTQFNLEAAQPNAAAA